MRRAEIDGGKAGERIKSAVEVPHDKLALVAHDSASDGVYEQRHSELGGRGREGVSDEAGCRGGYGFDPTPCQWIEKRAKYLDMLHVWFCRFIYCSDGVGLEHGLGQRQLHKVRVRGMAAASENPAVVIVVLRFCRRPPRRNNGDGHDVLESLERPHGKSATSPRASKADIQHVSACDSWELLPADAVSEL